MCNGAARSATRAGDEFATLGFPRCGVAVTPAHASGNRTIVEDLDETDACWLSKLDRNPRLYHQIRLAEGTSVAVDACGRRKEPTG